MALVDTHTIDSANLVDYPDTSVDIDGVVLAPRLSGVSYQGYELSVDGQHPLTATDNTRKYPLASLLKTVRPTKISRQQSNFP